MKNKIILAALFIVFVIAGFYLVDNNSNQNAVSVPVSFSHFAHTSKHKIKCIVCHRGVKTEVRAGIPDIQICSLCHSRIINPSSKREKQIYNYVKENKRIPWENYFRVPDYVYFSHRRHVRLGKLDCTECHGDMKKQTSPVLKNFKPFKMQFCFDCHLKEKVTSDCGNCHH